MEMIGVMYISDPLGDSYLWRNYLVFDDKTDNGWARRTFMMDSQNKGGKMSDTEVLDKTFHFILKQMVDTGQAPHYTEIAAELGVTPEEGRKTMHTLFESRIHGWLYPNTDFIASFAPFNNQPTQFRVTIEGQQKWFAQ